MPPFSELPPSPSNRRFRSWKSASHPEPARRRRTGSTGMHTFRSKRTVLRFQITAWLECATWLLAPLTVAVMTWGICAFDTAIITLAFQISGCCAICAAARWLTGMTTYCPLCRAAVLGAPRCQKHRHARKLLRSHRLKAAVDVVRLGQFTCPYCNERAAVMIRPAGKHGYGPTEDPAEPSFRHPPRGPST